MELLFLLAPAVVIGVLMVLPDLERWALKGVPTRHPVRVRLEPVESRPPVAPRRHAAATYTGRSTTVTGHDDLSPLEASAGKEPPLPHDPPPPPGWKDPIEGVEVLESPSAALGEHPDAD